MKELENQEVGEKMSWKGFASKLMQLDAGLIEIVDKNLTAEHLKSRALEDCCSIFLNYFRLSLTIFYLGKCRLQQQNDELISQ